MNTKLQASREMAKLISALKFLQTQRDELTELSDIEAFLKLEAGFKALYDEAAEGGHIIEDPISAVKSDWERISVWSNKVQTALGRAAACGEKLDQLSPDPLSAGQYLTIWRPKLCELNEIREQLESAPFNLEQCLSELKLEVRDEDWIKQRPYPELTQVAEAMGWDIESENEFTDEKRNPSVGKLPGESTDHKMACLGQVLITADPTEGWSKDIRRIEVPLVSSLLSVQGNSDYVSNLFNTLQYRYDFVQQLLQEHASQVEKLAEIERLALTGLHMSARRLFDQLPQKFADLDYVKNEKNVIEIEKSLSLKKDQVRNLQLEFQEIAKGIDGFKIFPPFYLNQTAKRLTQTARTKIDSLSSIALQSPETEFADAINAMTTELEITLGKFIANSVRSNNQKVISLVVGWCLLLLGCFVSLFFWQQAEVQRAADEKAAEKAAQEKRLAEERAAEELRLAEERAAEEQRLAEKKAAQERLLADTREISIRLDEECEWFFSYFKQRILKVDPGAFVMGGQQHGGSDEKPLTSVVIKKPFCLGELEVTQAQWIAVMDNNPSKNQGNDLPVDSISWNDAMSFCEKLNVLRGGKLPEDFQYALPTEAQWEYACRAGSTTDWFFGRAFYGEAGVDPHQYAWFDPNASPLTNHQRPGGTKLPNDWGFYDMYGNLSEWCMDWYGDYADRNRFNLQQGPAKGHYRVIRGGYWMQEIFHLRSSSRNFALPGNSNSFRGFRVALAPIQGR